MDAKEVLSEAIVALNHGDYRLAIECYDQLLQLQVMSTTAAAAAIGETIVQHHPQVVHKRRRKLSNKRAVSKQQQQLTRDFFVGFARALSCWNGSWKCFPVESACQVYRHLFLNAVPVDDQMCERLLQNATAALVERLRLAYGRGKCDERISTGDTFLLSAAAKNDLVAGDDEGQQHQQQRQQLADVCRVDPLLCSVCDDLLRMPVTAQCGHTVCQQCAKEATACNRCSAENVIVVPRQLVGKGEEEDKEASSLGNANALQKDVLISRLVDKWWGAELRVEPWNQRARQYLEMGQLDRALQQANESLEKGEYFICGN